jgi:hypothetical protein
MRIVEIKYMKQYIEQLKKQLEDIAGMWNGDDNGNYYNTFMGEYMGGEERSVAASDALEKIEELKALLEQLDIKI